MSKNDELEKKQQFKCHICGNTDPRSIGIIKGRPYCRKCISFRGEEVKKDDSYPVKAPIFIDYELSEDQKRLSKEILKNYKEGRNTLVHAVCGSGKTEIVLEVIKYAIRCGEKVGFAIPRRDVVIELCERFKNIFKENNVFSVYGGHTETLKGDLVVLTSHQLYRYDNYFDLLIMDEIDAFPFKGSEVLEAFFNRAVKGNYVLMSATPSKQVLNKFTTENNRMVELFSRFHHYPLPVPKVIIHKEFLLFVLLIENLTRFIKEKKPTMVFTPTIEKCEETYKYLSIFCKGGDYVHSQRKDRSKTIDKFRNGRSKYIVTTAVLERGVTVKNVQVIIYNANHAVYDRHALIQISGRVGRKKDAPTGEVLYLATGINEEIKSSISEIKRANENLQNLL